MTVESKSTEANYTHWHEAIDREPTTEGKNTGVGVLISELFGAEDSDEVAKQITS